MDGGEGTAKIYTSLSDWLITIVVVCSSVFVVGFAMSFYWVVQLCLKFNREYSQMTSSQLEVDADTAKQDRKLSEISSKQHKSDNKSDLNSSE